MKNEFKSKNNKEYVFISDAEVELHAHPFLGKNKIMDVVMAIELNNLNVVALQELDSSVYHRLKVGIQAYFPGTKDDDAGIRYDGNRFFLNSREYTTQEGFHLLTIGHSINNAVPNTEIRKLIDEGLEKNALVVIAHPFVDNGKTKTAGHISAEKEKELEKLCNEYPGQIALEWNGYCHPGLRKVLQGVMSILGHEVEYSNVNSKVQKFAYSPEIIKNNIPVVPGTDLHAINKNYLLKIGTTRMWTDIKGETPRDILDSIKTNIFNTKNYAFADSYASAPHVIGAFGIPLLKQMYKKK